jgi:hypothetical protein
VKAGLGTEDGASLLVEAGRVGGGAEGGEGGEGLGVVMRGAAKGLVIAAVDGAPAV